MPEISPGVRAKNGYIEVKRRDKGGRVVKARDHVITSQGMFSGKEMETEMRRVAEDVGASEDQIRIETYQLGDAPIEANPRHRGIPPATFSKGERRRMFSGFNPATDREDL
jgi:hypothetical protein